MMSELEVKKGICECCEFEDLIFQGLCEDCYMDGYMND